MDTIVYFLQIPSGIVHITAKMSDENNTFNIQFPPSHHIMSAFTQTFEFTFTPREPGPIVSHHVYDLYVFN